jgi:hypothetical protein
MTHPIYPGGPPCQPNCPGAGSMYHDGYADGYERAHRTVETVLRKVEEMPNAWVGMAGVTRQVQGFEAARRAAIEIMRAALEDDPA